MKLCKIAAKLKQRKKFSSLIEGEKMTLQEKKFWSAEISKVNSEIKVLKVPKKQQNKTIKQEKMLKV
jgi:hypothetical protein